jgi:transcriptional regulator with XRE-family HTH domain
MEESMSTRIGILRRKLGLNQTKFAKKIEVTSQFVSAVESGKTRFTDANIRLICLTFGVREEWLKTGKGEMIDEWAQLTLREQRLLEVFDKLSQMAQEMLIDNAKKILEYEQSLRAEALQNAPRSLPDPLEAPGGAKPEENPIHSKKRS